MRPSSRIRRITRWTVGRLTPGQARSTSAIRNRLGKRRRRHGLAGCEMARARCDTLRLRLLKIGARVKVSVRRITVSLASACPYQDVFWHAWDRLKPC